MTRFGECYRRVLYLLNRGRVEAALEEEMNAHRAMMGEPARFGNTLQLRERARDVWGWNWLDGLVRDLRFAAMLQTLLRTPLGARAAIATAGLTPWTRRNFARWMFEDYPRALLGTPDRWRRGAFSAPGAYRVQ